MSQRNPSMVTTHRPAIPQVCARFEWHCDNCGGDSIFDTEEWSMPSAKGCLSRMWPFTTLLSRRWCCSALFSRAGCFRLGAEIS